MAHFTPLLLCLLLPSCLTQALWSGARVVDSIARERTTIRCEITAVRAHLEPDLGHSGVSVDLARLPTESTANTAEPSIPHAELWSREQPGTITLRPLALEGPWLFALDPPPVVEDLQIGDIYGTQSAAGSTRRGRVTMRGTLPDRSIGRWMPDPGSLPPFRFDPFAPRWQLNALAGLDALDWTCILEGRSIQLPATPLAWLERSAPGTRDAKSSDGAEDYDLCVAFEATDGGRRFARLSAAALIAFRDQGLARGADGALRWNYSELWRAGRANGDAWPLLPRRDGFEQIAYTWVREVPTMRYANGVDLWQRILLTPLALGIDLVVGPIMDELSADDRERRARR